MSSRLLDDARAMAFPSLGGRLVPRPGAPNARARRSGRPEDLEVCVCYSPADGGAAAVMTLDDAGAFASSLPGVIVGTKWGTRTWMVGARGFAWQRPFTKADLKRFGDQTPPAGDILAVMVENLDAKDALLAISLPGFFTIPHFDGYAAVLIALRAARTRDVRAAIVDAWRCVAPSTVLAKRAVEKPASRPRAARVRARGRRSGR